ncbi:DegV family protein [Peribacillus sp. SCS-37]|uniref:DegV family protein n=1 Tax=Paraperibacillus esterisolvens TaxID=3115296 RepID=UPI003906BC85
MEKPKIAWITDTTSTLDSEYIKKHNIHVIPLNVVINQTSYRETIDITEKEFYERMSSEEGTFQSSQPSVGEFVELYEKLKAEYDEGIAIHASSKLTGTYETSVMAAEMAGFKLHALDSETGSYPLSFLVKKGISLAEDGAGAEEVIAALKGILYTTRLYLVPSNLNQLQKSGRVTSGQKVLATLFKINPILSIENGEAKIKDKVRTEKRAMNWLIDALGEEKKRFKIAKAAIVHANEPEKAEKLERLVKEAFPDIDTEITMLIPAAGVHTGAGTMGLSWVIEK